MSAVNTMTVTGTVAGQTVFHFHIHLIPRYKEDSVNIKWCPGSLTAELKEEIVSKMNA